MKVFFFNVFVFLFLSVSFAQEFNNPIIKGDIADPSVIKVNDTYYVTGTSSEWAPFHPIFTSTDLINWEQKGHVFNEKPEWTSHSFWAPELYYHNGKMYCYYTARRKTDNTSYIGVATAEGTTLEFTDHGPIVEYGTEAIDAFVYDDDGQLYLTWKAYGLDKRPIEILGSKLSDDGLRLEGEPFTLLRDDEHIGMEGQYHFKNGDYYYIIYSAKSCCGPSSDYDVRAARSKNFKGPYEKYTDNPILSGGNKDYLSIGHGTVVETPDRRKFYLSHGYLSGEGFYLGRQPSLHELIITNDGWLAFTTGKHASIKQTVPFAGTTQKLISDFNDDFNKGPLMLEWTWNYPYSDVDITKKYGKLYLTGTPTTGSKNGTVLAMRPQTTHYSYETKIGNKNNSLKGLTMYGDDQNLAVLGIQDETIILKTVKDGEETVIYQKKSVKNDPWLKIEVSNGIMLTFLYSADGKTWNKINETPIDGSSMVRWDRVARPGLIHSGKTSEPAAFTYFTLKQQDISSRTIAQEDSIVIVQISDPQFGFFKNNPSFDKETELYIEAVNKINQLKPDLVVITGDFVNNSKDLSQIKEFKRITKLIDDEIPVYLSPGNHDLEGQPDKKDFNFYFSNYGKGTDRFFTKYKNSTFIGINSVIIKSGKNIIEEEKQLRWLEKKLKKSDKSDNIVVFTHYPFFINDFNEKETYSNQNIEMRTKYFNLFDKYNVKAVFAGHLHNNSIASYRDILMITTNAVSAPLGEALPGMRIIYVNKNSVSHEYEAF